ncbi:MAG: hypothetical protein ABW185_11290 [Sedimenticola sp.]
MTIQLYLIRGLFSPGVGVDCVKTGGKCTFLRRNASAPSSRALPTSMWAIDSDPKHQLHKDSTLSSTEGVAKARMQDCRVRPR